MHSGFFLYHLLCSDFVILLYCDVFINLLTKLFSCVMCVCGTTVWCACMSVMCEYDTDTHTHPCKGPFSGTTRVCRYQKGKTNLDFTEARDSEWQRHQLGHMQVSISLQTDNHASTPPLRFFIGRMPLLPPNQQRQSTEGVVNVTHLTYFYYDLLYCYTVHFY